MHTELLRVSGNLETIKRTMTIELIRDALFAQNILIEKLLEFGYRQNDYPGESGTYKREGSIIRIWREDREYLIEYFDDVIESIIDISSRGRVHRDSLSLTPENQYIPAQISDLSKDLIDLISETPTILMGCEFLKEREYILANIRNSNEYSSITREGSEKIDISLPKIETLPLFLEYIEDDAQHGLICITRYEKKLREFFDINRCNERQTLEYRHIRESFVLQGGEQYLSERWKKYFQNGKLVLISDDILGEILVQNRVRKSTIKNLDLLLKIQIGDLVVHREHGIGRYIQILKKRIGLIEREYMEVEYK